MAHFSSRHILVTGGAGFIGSRFVDRVLSTWPECTVLVLDKLTYAGNLANLEGASNNPRYHFVQGDIADREIVRQCVAGADAVVNFAAETHVDRSIHDAASFVLTDVYGLQVLLAAADQAGIKRFVQVSTDEVYGDIQAGESSETDPLVPRSPYAASKAGGELLARSYWYTHQLPVLITRGSNTFGPRQFPEKLIPLFITNALDGQPVPVYGDGMQVRDWISVDDHCAGIETVLRMGTPGEAYNVGGGNPRSNYELTLLLLSLCGRGPELIRHVADRKGHDRRYAINSAKLHALGWRPRQPFADALASTVAWYLGNEPWWRPLRHSADFAEHYDRTYALAESDRE